MNDIEPRGCAMPGCCSAVEELSSLRASLTEAEGEIERLKVMVDGLLGHCEIGECMRCSVIVCPHGDALHFHHDGCPSCDMDDPSPQEQTQ